MLFTRIAKAMDSLLPTEFVTITKLHSVMRTESTAEKYILLRAAVVDGATLGNPPK